MPEFGFTDCTQSRRLLAEVFSSIEMYEHPSKLMLTNAYHAVEYLESSISFGAFTNESREALINAINERMTSDGAFKITKHAGLFVCNK